MVNSKPVPWWALLPVIGILLTVVLLLFWKRRPKERFLIFTPAIRVPTGDRPPAPVVEETPDDLTVIKGIGPKSAAVLVEKGIRTFAQLASTPVETLRDMMVSAGLRLVDPTTWTEQADFLAKHG
jgi:hypothetical protein